MLEPHLTLEELNAFLDEAFPAATRPSLGNPVSIAPGHVRMVLDPQPGMQRPGGIVSGPALMALVDVAAYAVIAVHNGPQAMAVTNSLSISFLRACKFAPIIAEAHLLKLGRRLATVDVRVWQGTDDNLIAQSTVGYSLPEPRM